MDYCIVVWVDTNVQLQRVMARDKISKYDAVSRINSQMPLEEKKKYANILIDNNFDISKTKEQVEDIIDFISKIS